jgi:excisionase family DNA binding protein
MEYKISEVLESAEGPRRLMKMNEAADYLNCSKSHLWRMVKKEEVPFLRLGKLVRFEPDQLKKWAAEQAAGE